MRRTALAAALAVCFAGLYGCAEQATDAPATQATETAQADATPATDNTLLAEWTGPYQGVPAFDKMQVADLQPAMETAMANNLAELQKIADQTEAPTFSNTIEAMEDTGRELGRVFTYFGIWSGNMSSPEFRQVQQVLSPKLANFQSQIVQNKALFERVKAVKQGDEYATLRGDQQRLVDLVYNQFARAGADLDEAAKARTAEINERLAQLYTQFSNNVLADEEGYVLYLTEDQLGGLPQSFIDGAAAIAKDKGEEGKYAVLNTRSSMDPFLTFSDQRDLREKVWRTYYSRGDNGDEHDNNALIAEILKLRDERVELLGFDNYAAWRLDDLMAGTPEAALGLLEAVWPAATARAREEVADMQKVADAEGADFKIAAWDYRYYAEKVRKDRYDLDSNEVKQYLQLDKLTDAMFYVAGELFDFKFTPLEKGTVPVFHPDVGVWEVTKLSDGSHVGLWYLDPYARQGKRSGAWASMYRAYEDFDGKGNVLSSNNSNFIKGAEGEPLLISWDDANTFFHEFGHALHFLAADVRYPTLSSGGVRDYTEFQSQLLERWLFTQPVIDNYFVHVETGEPMPAELVEKIQNAATFNQGFATTEYLASALIDLKLHTADPEGIDADAFERDTLNAMGMPEEIVMRHRTPHFGHVFSGEGYAAAYYGYLWAEVLTSDAAEAFAEAPGGFYDKELSKKLVDHLFAVRNAVPPDEAYRAFRGRDATIDALLRDRGFPVPGEGGAAGQH